MSLGQGALLAKIDFKQAYCNIPVHPEDRPLLGMAWRGKVYLDKLLPFGLRSAPIILFSAKESKTDPGRKGVDIFVGCAYYKLCPIAAVMAYLAKRGNAPGFLFKLESRKPLTKANL